MDPKDQIILALSQQNMRLSDEVMALRAELAKFQTAPVATPIAPKKTKKVVDPNHVKSPARVETGKRLALWNSNRKSMKQAFDQWRENMPKSEE
jgi:hypothetical protein